MYAHEGVFSYWKGILPPILAETPKRATKFVCFEQYKQLFMFGSDKASPLVSQRDFIEISILNGFYGFFDICGQKSLFLCIFPLRSIG